MKIRHALLGVSLASASLAQAPSGVVTLEGLREQSRVLLIFAAKPDDPQLEIQLRTLGQHAQDATERNLVAIALPYNNPSPTPATVSMTEAAQIRRDYNVAPTDFVVVLIGKDGGEKLRSNKPLSITKLDETIDAMPMRKTEMQRKTR